MRRRDDARRVAAVPRTAVHRPSWSSAAWLAVPVLAATAQLLRGAWDDAAIFLVPAAALAADAVGVLPRPRGDAARLRRLLPAGTVAVGAVLAAAPRHGVLDGLAVAVLGALVLGAAWPDPPLPRPRVRTRSAVLWAGAAVAIALWELVSFVLGLASSSASAAHPAISDLLDPVAGTPAGRVLLAAAWVLAGVALLRRDRR